MGQHLPQCSTYILAVKVDGSFHQRYYFLGQWLSDISHHSSFLMGYCLSSNIPSKLKWGRRNLKFKFLTLARQFSFYANKQHEKEIHPLPMTLVSRVFSIKDQLQRS